MDIIPAASNAPLTPEQTAALKKLHDAATQLEGVFVGMLFKEMHEGESKSDIFGQKSNAEDTWNDMLDEKRADAIAKTGQFGIAKMVESQLRASVLASVTPIPGTGTAPKNAYATPALPVAPPVPATADPENEP
jgi:Rod binding domain-containing protein